MLQISKTKYFDSDDEFYKFAVVPVLIAKEWPNSIDGKTRYYTDFNFSYKYQNALKKGHRFVIKDPNSQICKHQAVSFRTITKPIKNLDDWIYDKNFKF